MADKNRKRDKIFMDLKPGFRENSILLTVRQTFLYLLRLAMHGLLKKKRIWKNCFMRLMKQCMKIKRN